jgi:hypothetical protein
MSKKGRKIEMKKKKKLTKKNIDLSKKGIKNRKEEEEVV